MPRNRRAALASFIVMFMQQFCGINAIAYYSSNIFAQSGFNNTQALLASFGYGLINWLFAFPAVYTIDTFGRRNLLLTTFPLMALFMLLAGCGFWVPEGPGRVGVVALGIYLFAMAYSPGEGPVPFTVSNRLHVEAHRADIWAAVLGGGVPAERACGGDVVLDGRALVLVSARELLVL